MICAAIGESGTCEKTITLQEANDVFTQLAGALHCNYSSNPTDQVERETERREWRYGKRKMQIFLFFSCSLFLSNQFQLSCMRTRDANTVVNALPMKTALFFGSGVQWLPVVDGYEVPSDLSDRLRAGNFTPVPYLTGANLVSLTDVYLSLSLWLSSLSLAQSMEGRFVALLSLASSLSYGEPSLND